MSKQTNDSPVLYTEEPQTPTNLETTAQAHVTKGENGVILDQYQDQNNAKQYATTPNTTATPQNSATGSGLTAAEIKNPDGTTEVLNYNWETKAEERAGLDYESEVLKTQANYLTNRQTIDAEGQAAQNQVAMQKYAQNQSSEKAGWTGGYILDTERQMEYLKQTINSQMYGAMELQKYGYDTSLAAARLAYDTNRYDLALQYYNTALQRAVTEAEITGYYIAPEVSEMLDEYSIASRTLNDENATADEKIRADRVLAAVYDWFNANGISKQGVETYTHIIEERKNKWSIESALKYIDQAEKQISADVFTKVDANGNALFNDDKTDVQTVNFKTMPTDELLTYINGNEHAKQQYYGYLDGKITDQAEIQFKDWLISNGMMTKNADNTYSPKDDVNYEVALYRFLNTSQIYKDLVEELSHTDPEQSSTLQELYENWDFQVTLPNGTSIIKTFKELDDAQTKYNNSITSGTLQQLTLKDVNGNYVTEYKPIEQEITVDGTTSKVVHLEDAKLTLWNIEASIHRSGTQWDISLSNGIGDKYDIELKDKPQNSKITEEDTKLIAEIYERTYNKKLSEGAIIIYNDELYVYDENTMSQDVGTWGSKTPGFCRIQKQCTGGAESDLAKKITDQIKNKTGAA